MSALFPPWTNTATRVVLLAIAVGAVALIGAPMVFARMPIATGEGNPLLQPVQFDHRHHVRDDGIACLYCHGDAQRSAYAGVPATELCMGCHNQIWNDSVLLAPVRASIATGQPIAWQRVYSLPDFVYFDHAVHVTGGIGCATCHGPVDQMAAVYQVVPLTMSWCVDCHRARGPRRLTTCSTCHR